MQSRLFSKTTSTALVLLLPLSVAQATTIGHWRFEEAGFADGTPLPGAPLAIVDSSGNGNHGTALGAGFTYESGPGDTVDPGFSGQSIRSSGAGAIHIPTIQLGFNGDPWTVELMIRRTSLTGTWDDLLMTEFINQYGSGSTWGLHLNGGGAAGQLVFFDTPGGPYPSSDPGSLIPLDTWTHVAVTNDGANFEFFLDGVSAGTAVGTFHFNGLVIGRTDENYVGFIDEVRVSDEVLSPAQFFTESTSAVPEPSSVLLALAGLAGVAIAQRRRRLSA